MHVHHRQLQNRRHALPAQVRKGIILCVGGDNLWCLRSGAPGEAALILDIERRMAVYTEVTDDALAGFLADYNIGTAVAFRGIAEGVENSNYMLRTTDGDFILTLYEKRVNPADLPWFLGLMTHLVQHGITCPLPVPAQDGQALRMLAGKHAAITTFLPGVWPRRVRVEHCGPLGAALAGLHLAGAGYPTIRANALGPSAWGPLLARSLAPVIL